MAVEQPGTPRCANCGVEIPWIPTVHRGKTYCCGGCAQGGPCYCSYDLSMLDWQLGRGPILRVTAAVKEFALIVGQ